MNNFNDIKNLENLKKLRVKKNITQIKLSTDLGVSQELISRYEQGSSFPQPNMLIKLANYFNCSVDYLLGLTDVTTSYKFLNLTNEEKESIELLSKYKSLKEEDRKLVDKFLEFLSNK